ncbi:MAG: hypothetical protein GX806_03655 [Lentisphaerae bacterium]|nr:hypothetical protein [Lentisphaerota bacterium]
MSKDQLIYRGKSKDVYAVHEVPYAGKYRLVFSYRATGYIANGQVVFDPGRDVVVGAIAGKGATACRFATHFFRLLQAKGIPSHYIETVSENEMIVEPATPLGMPVESPEFPGAAPLLNLEFTWRNNATGSFWRRYPFVRPGKNLRMIVEIWTKGDTDTLITLEALAATGALRRDEIERSIALVQDIATIVSQEFAAHGLHVVDGKFELGRLQGAADKIVIIDEISPDVLRVCRGYVPDAEGHCQAYQQCVRTALVDGRRTIENKYVVPAPDFMSMFR